MRQIGVVLVALLSLASADPDIRLTIRPLIAQAPQDLHVQILLRERHVDNRALRITVDGEHYHQSGVKQLDGDQSQRAWDLWWPQLPCGRYVVLVELFRVNREKPLTAKAAATFYGADPNCPTTEDLN